MSEEKESGAARIIHPAGEHHAAANEVENQLPHEKPNASIKLWIMAIALGLLVIIGAVQAVELVSLKSKLDSGVATVKAGVPIAGAAAGSLQKNLQNLPTMVGGC